MNKIVLLGYMGSGKSTVGKMLATALNIPFRDLDEVIETSLNSTIPKIFEEQGEIFFRKKETEILEEILNTPRDMVIAAGGGTPCYGNNMDVMLTHANQVVYLQLSVPELVNRLESGRDHRPLISHLPKEALEEYVGKHLLERSPFYHHATIVIQSDGKTPEEIVEDILKELG